MSALVWGISLVLHEKVPKGHSCLGTQSKDNWHIIFFGISPFSCLTAINKWMPVCLQPMVINSLNQNIEKPKSQACRPLSFSFTGLAQLHFSHGHVLLGGSHNSR